MFSESMSPNCPSKKSPGNPSTEYRFVRSGAWLSDHGPGSKAAGHVLTALEAYRAFGLDILVEAVEYGSAIILSKRRAIESSIHDRRKDLGLNVTSVARSARLSPDVVELAETNPHDVSIQAVERIAFALGLDESRLAYHPTAGADEGS